MQNLERHSKKYLLRASQLLSLLILVGFLSEDLVAGKLKDFLKTNEEEKVEEKKEEEKEKKGILKKFIDAIGGKKKEEPETTAEEKALIVEPKHYHYIYCEHYYPYPYSRHYIVKEPAREREKTVWNIITNPGYLYSSEKLSGYSLNIDIRSSIGFGFTITYLRYLERLDSEVDRLDIFDGLLNFSLKQMKKIIFDFKIGVEGMFYEESITGFKTGISFLSFPLRPFLLEGKALFSIFQKTLLAEFYGGTGLLFKRLGLTFGYHVSTTRTIDIMGPRGGLFIWF